MTPEAASAPDEPEILDSHPYEPTPPPPGGSGPRLDSFRSLLDRTSLRTKLITAVLALVIVALAAISIASTYMLRSYVTEQHDNEIQSVISNYNATGNLPTGYVTLGSATSTHSDVVIGLQSVGSALTWDPNSHAPGQVSADPLPLLPTRADWAGTVDHPVTLTVPAQSGPDSWRVAAETANVQVNNVGTGAVTQQTITLVSAVDLGNVSALTSQLALFDLTVGGGIVLILALAAIGVVRANLRPLNDIELTAGQIAAGHLNHRIRERDPRTEIGSLGQSLNAMLGQIETAFHARQESEEAARRSEERMRRFIADASHELRTPLTTLRGFAEFYRQRGGVAPGGGTAPNGMTPNELDRLMHRLESEAARMGLLVEDLLQLARIDQQRPLDMGLVDLLSLAADAVQDARIVSPDRQIDLVVAPGAAFLVEGDEARLRQVIGNLVTNARVHTPPEASIRVAIASGALKRGTPAVVLDVLDNGPGMTDEQARHVFERFYRADESRGRSSGGTGLGLAIVAGLVEAHGGEVSVLTAPGQGADFRVKLPLSPDAVSSSPEEDPGDFDALDHDPS
ncbi:MAG TPA: HAMP domain-containing sensor histidine kinase [Trebonia sp.]|nr:HAMP domain-containing sensor histidine kinase [Trebonia sp.]